MSDVPHSTGWWQAGDGRWYPPPPGLTDEMPARPPTPPPDHPPYAFDPMAQQPSAPLLPTPKPTRSRRTSLIIAGLAAVVVGTIILILGITFAVSDHASKTASSNDPKYQMVVEDLLESELTNLVFIETFWDGYGSFTDEWQGSTEAERPAVAARWFSDIESQVAQFQDDLQQIEDDYAARSYADGSIPDSIRDLAIDHYGTWQAWAAQIVSIANEWYSNESSSLSLYGYVTEMYPRLDSNIETSFMTLCETLNDTQPTDGSYMQTIFDICQTQ